VLKKMNGFTMIWLICTLMYIFIAHMS
jgi:hypothetical protein